jgi:DNA-binding CsgD family transcriptional regulator
MTNLPAYNTHPIRCANSRCCWTGLEGQRPMRPATGLLGTLQASVRVCPLCESDAYEFLSEQEAQAWRSDQAATAYGLSMHEIDVIRVMADGNGVKSAAQLLGKSMHTVREQLGTAYRKMGCRSIERAVLLAERAGILRGVK